MLKNYKPAILFLVKYIVIYLGLNTLYAVYISSFYPDVDPVTAFVTDNVTDIMSHFDDRVSSAVTSGRSRVPIYKEGRVIVEVFEGCNSVNVIIVFVAFIFSFSGPSKGLLKFLLSGVISIYLINLLRIIGLYHVALEYPTMLYFFHKFLFTGVIYLVVFVYWYFWILNVKTWVIRSQSQE